MPSLEAYSESLGRPNLWRPNGHTLDGDNRQPQRRRGTSLPLHRLQTMRQRVPNADTAGRHYKRAKGTLRGETRSPPQILVTGATGARDTPRRGEGDAQRHCRRRRSEKDR
jgi:hypothetical protein